MADGREGAAGPDDGGLSGGLDTPTAAIVFLGIEDAGHMDAEAKARLLAQYPEHERAPRLHGIPQLGSGTVYNIPDEQLLVDPFEVPSFWPQIGAIDFGWEDPTAAVRFAWDRDDDRVFLIGEHKQSRGTPLHHAAALKPWGSWLPWAWPQDGIGRGKDGGAPLSEQYRSHGLGFLPEAAQKVAGYASVEAGVSEILERMETNRFKVVRGKCAEWLLEKRLYHRKKGLIVDANDHLMDATRYGIMCLPMAQERPSERRGAASAFRPGGW